jgi:predicted RNA-binding Zn-ribbon protein involved in translation (DUF1610 family)
MSENQVYCPKCGSNQVHAEKRGFTITTGLIGAKNVYITCLACGKRFSPGEGIVYRDGAPVPKAGLPDVSFKAGLIIMMVILLPIALIMACCGRG